MPVRSQSSVAALFAGTFLLALLPLGALAQEALPEIVVTTPSLVPLEAPRVGSTLTVITREQMVARGDQTVADALRTVPGVSVSPSGPRGALTQVRVRGAEANHTLVVVDGVPLNQVGDGDTNYADLLVADIERIEVVRGPQSGIWGPNAHAGVIQIITRTGKGLARPELTGNLEIGTRGTFTGAATLRGSHGPWYGAFTVQGYKTDGYNIARTGTERDGSHALTFTGKVGVDLSDWVNIEASFRHVRRYVAYDTGGFPLGAIFQEQVDANNKGRNNITVGRIAATFKALDDRLTQVFSADINHERNKDTADELPSFSSRGDRIGLRSKTAYTFETPGFLNAKNTIVGGIEHIRETYRYLDAFNTEWVEGRSRERTGLYGELISDLPSGLTLSGAIRQDWNSYFADAFTWRLTAAQRFETSGTRLHASIGRGVTNPTFFEQYGYTPAFFIGNPNIKPESSLGWDIGIEQKFFGGLLTADLTYFRANLRDEITTVFVGFSSTVVNATTRTERQGIELTLTANPAPWLSIGGTYTYVDAEDATGKEVLRRPKHMASLDATVRFNDQLRLAASLVYNGGVRDVRFQGPPFYASEDVFLKAYTLVRAKLSYDINAMTTAYVRAENLFGQKFEPLYGYRGPGFAAYAGLNVRFGQ